MMDEKLNCYKMSLSNFVFIILVIFSNHTSIKPMKIRDTDTSFRNSIKGNTVLYNSSANTNKLSNITTREKITKVKKWQVQRVSRKQLEIVNMLWKKTKIFIEIESATTAMPLNLEATDPTKSLRRVTRMPQTSPQKVFPLTQSQSNVQTTTPSFIEFYYLDDLNENFNQKDSYDISNFYDHSLTLQNSFLTLKITGETCKTKTSTSSKSKIKKSLLSVNSKPEISLNLFGNTSSSVQEDLINATCPATNQPLTNERNHTINRIKEDSKKSNFVGNHKNNPRVSSAADRIKFFEIYDSDTYKPCTVSLTNTINLISKKNSLDDENKINIDKASYEKKHDHTITRYAKKIVDKSQINDIDILDKSNNTVKSKTKRMGIREKISNCTPSSTKTVMLNSVYKNYNFSKPVKWTDFPFIAVYLYEPLQVRCDAAAISPHWLISAATCLYRRHKEPLMGFRSRSAFVAYCTEDWRRHEKISYVTRSLIHPRFHPEDIQRKHLYNIGAIQVENSLADTCNGWSAVSLMSHQFTAPKEGISATAIGWGLDRYDFNYAMVLPRYPLMAYNSLVYSENCPGNHVYNKFKEYNIKHVKNVYCLLLPTYSTEENDAVHGALLLIGGKLFALYLQEERRFWGVQSAQYTGIWRLLPWLLDVAREPEDKEIFSFEI